jgi:GT2 family glycosyltransferase
MTGSAGITGLPDVSVVVLNFNGRDYLPACLQALAGTDYPDEKMEVTVVDNASSDGSAELVEREFPDVRLLRSGGNVGFAVGNNLGIRAVGGKFVALINPDTEVESGWLRPLVETMEAGADIAAACPKLLLYEDRLAIWMESETFVPRDLGLGDDDRTLGLRVYGARAQTSGGEDVAVEFRGGFGGIEIDEDGREFRWTTGKGDLGIMGGEGELQLSVEVSAPRPDGEGVHFLIGTGDEKLKEALASREPKWSEMTLPAPAWEEARAVVQNTGSELLPDGSSRDRGTLSSGGSPYADWDGERYDRSVDVFSLCGAGVLLRREPLLELGGFDEKMFMYYEDTDLAYRLRRRGWRVRYEPRSVIRHHHAALAGEWSPFFLEQVTRNRLYVLLKHRSWGVAGKALLGLLRDTGRAGLVVLRQLVRAPRNSGPAMKQFWPRVQALAWLARMTPAVLAARRRENRAAPLREADLAEWVVQQ